MKKNKKRKKVCRYCLLRRIWDSIERRWVKCRERKESKGYGCDCLIMSGKYHKLVQTGDRLEKFYQDKISGNR